MLGFLMISLAIMARSTEYSVELPIEKVAREVAEVSQNIEQQITEAEKTLAELKLELKQIRLERAATTDPKERDELWYKEMAARSEITKMGYELVTTLNARLKNLRSKVGTLQVLLVEASEDALKSAKEMEQITRDIEKSLKKAKRTLKHVQAVWLTVKNNPDLSDEVKRIAGFEELQRKEEEQILYSGQEIAKVCSTYAEHCLELSLQVQDCEDQISEIVDILDRKTGLIQGEAHIGKILVENKRAIDAIKYSFDNIDLPHLEGILSVINEAIEFSIPHLKEDMGIGNTHFDINLLEESYLSDEEMEKLGGD